MFKGVEVSKALVRIDDQGNYARRYLITEDGLPITEINRWLEVHSIQSYQTGKQYAYRIAKYLRFLQSIHIHYREATKETIVEYLKYLVYGGKVAEVGGNMTLPSVKYHLTVIKDFYNWMEDNGLHQGNPVKYGNLPQKKTKTAGVKTKFLYGQIYEFNFKQEKALLRKLRFKKRRNHIKWYEDEQIRLINANLPTARDKVIFKISYVCGLRIGEILGLRITDFDYDRQILKVVRNLNIENEALVKTEEREVEIDDLNLLRQLQEYIYGERQSVVNTCDSNSQFLFLNHQGRYQGMPTKPANFLRVLKSAALKAGINPSEIRTHSGRSTRAQYLLDKMIEHPEKGINDHYVMEQLGWKHPDSMKPYKRGLSMRHRKKVAEFLKNERVAQQQISEAFREASASKEVSDNGTSTSD